MAKLMIFSGSSHGDLAAAIAKKMGVPLSKTQISRFACGETYARPIETVRGRDVFIIQTTTHDVNENLMELFIMLDALKRSFASKIHVVMPYYAYSRQDRVSVPREPISAKLVADLLSTAGADHVITMNLHSGQEQGFFDYPVDNLSSYGLFVDYLKKKKLKDMVIVSPDAGGAKEAKKVADEVGAGIAFIHKHRVAFNVSKAMEVIGNVKGKTCVIYDDIIDTGGSVCNAREALIKAGANKEMYLIATHPVFSDPAVQRLKDAKFKEVVVTDSVPLPKEKQFPGLKVISIAPMMAKIIENVHSDRSVSQITK